MSKVKSFIRINKQTALAFKQHNLESATILNWKHLIIYEAIAGYARGCTCSESTLGAWAGISDNRTVRRILMELRDCELIHIKHRERNTSLIRPTQEGKSLIRTLTMNAPDTRGYITLEDWQSDTLNKAGVYAPLARFIYGIICHFSQQKGYGAWRGGRAGLQTWIPDGKPQVIKRTVKNLIDCRLISEEKIPACNTRALQCWGERQRQPYCKYRSQISEDDDIPF
ncbi:MAG: hypothetical protein IKW48_06195 [Akkermansia sp.]|nr:hypothetical protein [Akkermansia sp.]